MAERYEVDAVIVGGGACGMMAALRAAECGAKSVAIFEKSTKQGSNSEYSSGSLVAGGTRWQREAGIVDTPERHAEDILAVSGDVDAKDVVYAVCEAAPKYVEWLADELGYPIELGIEMARAGQSVPRIHRDRDRIGGPYLVGALRQAIDRSDVIGFVDNTPVVGLLESDGTVEGARIAEGGGVSIVRAGATVLAADGFAANREMLARYCPGSEDLPFGGVSTSNGDAIEWGLSLGAAVRNMGCLLGHGLMVVSTGTRLDAVLPQVGAVLVNSSGDRFVEERECGYSKLSTRILGQPGRRAVLIWDETAMMIAKESKPMRESTAARAYTQYEDLGGLAEGTGLPVGKLETAFEESEFSGSQAASAAILRGLGDRRRSCDARRAGYRSMGPRPEAKRRRSLAAICGRGIGGRDLRCQRRWLQLRQRAPECPGPGLDHRGTGLWELSEALSGRCGRRTARRPG